VSADGIYPAGWRGHPGMNHGRCENGSANWADGQVVP
jgi:hypothetical protein